MLEKEKLDISKTGEVTIKPAEKTPPKEVAGWLERVEKKDIYLSKPVIDDQTGQTLVSAPSAKQPKIILPLNKQQILDGLKQKISEAIRWLAEWCMRLIKMDPDEVKLKT